MVERKEYLQKLWSWKDEQVIKVVTGIRRCGKSTLLKQYQNKLKSAGVTEEQIISINFEELENENAKLREELEYYKNRKLSGRQKHNAKWMAIYNNFVAGYESGMTMIEIARRNNVSERTIYRYKAYYDKMRKVEADE